MKKNQVQTQSAMTPGHLDRRGSSVWEERAEIFGDIYKSVRSNRALHDAIVKKTPFAFQQWAMLRMGKRREQYLRDAIDVFYVLCALNVALLGKSVEEAAEESPFHFRLLLSKKRAGFIERIPEYISYVKEYETIRQAVESAKKAATSSGHFRLLLREVLPKPLPGQFEKKLQNYFPKSTRPSQIAQDYVGCAHAVSPATIKKVVALVKGGNRMLSKLQKELVKGYLRMD